MDRDAKLCRTLLLIGLGLSALALVSGGVLHAAGATEAGEVLGGLGVWSMIAMPLAAFLLSAAIRSWGSLLRASAVVLLIAGAVIYEVVR